MISSKTLNEWADTYQRWSPIGILIDEVRTLRVRLDESETRALQLGSELKGAMAEVRRQMSMADSRLQSLVTVELELDLCRAGR